MTRGQIAPFVGSYLRDHLKPAAWVRSSSQLKYKKLLDRFIKIVLLRHKK